MLDDGNSYLRAETVNVTPLGAKIRLTERLEVGTAITLKIRPTDRPVFETRAIVWRIDPDGAAVLFLGSHKSKIPVAVKPLQPSREGTWHLGKIGRAS